MQDATVLEVDLGTRATSTPTSDAWARAAGAVVRAEAERMRYVGLAAAHVGDGRLVLAATAIATRHAPRDPARRGGVAGWALHCRALRRWHPGAATVASFGETSNTFERVQSGEPTLSALGRPGSIWPGWVVHVAYNVVGGILAR